MKAVLVINMPDNCSKCFLESNLDLVNLVGFYCIGNQKERTIRPDWCPLRPLPRKMKHEDEIDYEYGYIDGRNELINEILGETE